MTRALQASRKLLTLELDLCPIDSDAMSLLKSTEVSNLTELNLGLHYFCDRKRKVWARNLLSSSIHLSHLGVIMRNSSCKKLEGAQGRMFFAWNKIKCHASLVRIDLILMEPREDRPIECELDMLEAAAKTLRQVPDALPLQEIRLLLVDEADPVQLFYAVHPESLMGRCLRCARDRRHRCFRKHFQTLGLEPCRKALLPRAIHVAGRACVVADGGPTGHDLVFAFLTQNADSVGRPGP